MPKYIFDDKGKSARLTYIHDVEIIEKVIKTLERVSKHYYYIIRG